MSDVPSVASVYMRLRVDQAALRKDIDDALKGINTQSAGRNAGTQYSSQFGQALRNNGSKHGQSFMEQVSKGISIKRGLIAGAITAALAVGPAALALGGAAIGVGVAAAAGAAIYKQLSSQVSTATKALAKDTSARAKAVKDLAAAEKSGNKARIAQAKQELAAANQQIATDRKRLELAKAQIAPFNAAKAALLDLRNRLLDVGRTSLVNSGILGKFTGALNSISRWVTAHRTMFTQFFAAAAPYVTIFTNFFLRLVGTLIPAFTRLMNQSRPAVQHVLDSLIKFTRTGIVPFLDRMGKSSFSSAVAFGKLLVAISPLLPAIGRLAGFAATMLARWPALLPVVVGLATGFKALLIVSRVAGAFKGFQAAAKILKDFNIVSKLTFLTNPWVLLGVAVIAAAVLIVKYWKPISRFFVGVWHAIYGGFIAPLKHWFHDNWTLMFGTVGLIIRYWKPISGFFADIWRHIWSGFVAPLINFFTKSIPHAFDVAWGHVKGWANDVKNAFIKMWQWVYRNVWTPVYHFFTGTLPGWFDAAIRFVNSHFIAPFRNNFINGWRWVYSNVWVPVYHFFTSTLPGWFDSAIRFVNTHFVTPFRNAISGAWNWVYQHVFVPVYNFFTKTLPGWFDTAVGAIGRVWDKVRSVAAKPIHFIIDTVYNHGIVPVVDAIAGVVGLHPLNPVKLGFAKGTSGAPPGWAWVGEEGPELAYFHGGEHVLSHQQSMATGLRVPGFAKGTNPPRQQIPTTTPAMQKSRAQAVHAAQTTPHSNPLGSLGHEIAHIATNVVNAPVQLVKKGIHALRALAGDALAAGMNAILNPLLNAIPGSDSPLGKWIIGGIKSVEQNMVDWIKGASAGTVGSGSGSSVANYAKSFATGKGHPYVTGGAGPGGWDCSGFTAYVYDHYGYFPGRQGTRFGTSESQWADSVHLQPSGAVPGALAFFQGSHYAPPGHVGIVINPQQYVSAYDHAEGTVVKNINGSSGKVWGFRIPKGGFKSGGSGPAGVGSSAGEMANGRQLYNYLLSNLFGGSKVGAAGAAASIWGESNWNPFAQGTGGRGLIGWTPPSTISDAAFRGGMRTQLPAIIQFVNRNNDMGVINQMKHASSVAQAAAEWGMGVERFGINDVHTTGISLATQIMNGHKYGGSVNEPVLGIGLRSGTLHTFGEQGSERVVPGYGDPLERKLDKLIALMEQAPARTATGVAKALKAPKGQEAQAARQGAR